MKASFINRQNWLLVISMLSLFSCKKNDQPLGATSSSTSSSINAPVSLNLYPGSGGSSSFFAPRNKKLFIPVTEVGSIKARLQAIFDTGSEGLVLYASRFLPDSLVTKSGFNFNGRDSIIFGGMTITTTQLTRGYGVPGNSRTLSGNVAYAIVKLGDSISGTVITNRMPIFLAYQIINDQTKGPESFETNQDGICGVRSGSIASNTEWVTDGTGLKTPFSYITYGEGLDAGFLLSPVNVFNWDSLLNPSGNAGKPVLTIGIANQAAKGYFIQQQHQTTNGYSTYVQGIITYNNKTINSVASFDTGTPNNCIISDSSATNPFMLLDGVQVSYISPEGINYSYTVQNASFTTTVEAAKRNTLFSLNFFMNHYYMLDYSRHLIGVKPL